MQSCAAVVVSVSRQGTASTGFQDRSEHSALEGPDMGTRHLYNRELGLISYNNREEIIGSWHEVDYFWRDDDGFGNGIPNTGACAGELTRTLPQPKCQTEGIVIDGNVFHYFKGIAISLDVEKNYMLLWHDYLGLIVHFGDDLNSKFEPLQPFKVKCQPCAEHRFFGFHAVHVSPAARIRLKYLFFSTNAEVERYDEYLVAKCNNNHRVILLDKKRALVPTSGVYAVGAKINLAYYRIQTIWGPIYVSGFVSQDNYYDEYFAELARNRTMTEYMHDGFLSGTSNGAMFSPAALKAFCQQHLNCWNVDQIDLCWYTNRFIPDNANSIGGLSVRAQEVVPQEELGEIHQQRDDDFRELVFLPESVDESQEVPHEEHIRQEETIEAVEEQAVDSNNYCEAKENAGVEEEAFQEEDEDLGMDVDIDLANGDMGDESLENYDDCDEEPVSPVNDNQSDDEDYPGFSQRHRDPRGFGYPNDKVAEQQAAYDAMIEAQKKEDGATIATWKRNHRIAKFKIFDVLSPEQMAGTLNKGISRMKEVTQRGFVTEPLKARPLPPLVKRVPFVPFHLRGPQGGAPGPSTFTQPMTPPLASSDTHAMLSTASTASQQKPLGFGAPIPSCFLPQGGGFPRPSSVIHQSTAPVTSGTESPLDQLLGFSPSEVHPRNLSTTSAPKPTPQPTGFRPSPVIPQRAHSVASPPEPSPLPQLPPQQGFRPSPDVHPRTQTAAFVHERHPLPQSQGFRPSADAHLSAPTATSPPLPLLHPQGFRPDVYPVSSSAIPLLHPQGFRPSPADVHPRIATSPPQPALLLQARGFGPSSDLHPRALSAPEPTPLQPTGFRPSPVIPQSVQPLASPPNPAPLPQSQGFRPLPGILPRAPTAGPAYQGRPLGMGAPIPSSLLRSPPSPVVVQQHPADPTPVRRIQIVPRPSNSTNSESEGSQSRPPRAMAPVQRRPLYLPETLPTETSSTDYLARVLAEIDTEESMTTRLILLQILTNDVIQRAIQSYFPALEAVLEKMFTHPREVSLPSLNPLTDERKDSTNDARLDRIMMEGIVYDLIKTKSQPLWASVVAELPFVNDH